MAAASVMPLHEISGAFQLIPELSVANCAGVVSIDGFQHMDSALPNGRMQLPASAVAFDQVCRVPQGTERAPAMNIADVETINWSSGTNQLLADPLFAGLFTLSMISAFSFSRRVECGSTFMREDPSPIGFIFKGQDGFQWGGRTSFEGPDSKYLVYFVTDEDRGTIRDVCAYSEGTAIDSRSIRQETSRPKCKPELKKCLKRLDEGKSCLRLPLPDFLFSEVLPIDPKGYTLVKQRENVWVITEGTYQSIMVSTKRNLYLIDVPLQGFIKRDETGAVVGNLITDAIAEIRGSSKPQRFSIIYTHEHFDHIGGATIVFNYLRETYPRAKFSIVGSVEIKEPLAKQLSGRAPQATRFISKRTKFTVNKEITIVLIPYPGGHTTSDLIVFIPRYRSDPGILMYVDVMFPGWNPPFDLTFSEDVRINQESHERILKMKFDIFVGGHLTHLGTRKDVEISKEYIDDLLDAAQEGVVVGGALPIPNFAGIFDPNSRYFGNQWHLVDGLQENMNGVCYRIMMEKWGCRLGGVDVFLNQQCNLVVTWWRTDT